MSWFWIWYSKGLFCILHGKKSFSCSSNDKGTYMSFLNRMWSFLMICWALLDALLDAIAFLEYNVCLKSSKSEQCLGKHKVHIWWGFSLCYTLALIVVFACVSRNNAFCILRSAALKAQNDWNLRRHLDVRIKGLWTTAGGRRHSHHRHFNESDQWEGVWIPSSSS